MRRMPNPLKVDVMVDALYAKVIAILIKCNKIPVSYTHLVEHGSTKIIIPANSTTAYINGKANSLDVPAKIVNDRIMIPLRFVSEAIEKTVIWDDPNKTVLIY